MLPGTLLYVSYVKLDGDVAALAGGVETERDWAYYATLVLGLLATLGVTTLLGRLARKALREVTDE